MNLSGASYRKVVQREEKIKSLQDELAAGERNIDSYISAIRHCVVAFDSSWYSSN